MYNNTTFTRKDTWGIETEFNTFINKLPSIDKLWNESDLKYGCCGNFISKDKSVGNSAECPYCLEKIEIKKRDSSSYCGDGFTNEKVIFPVIIDKKYKMDENGNFILHEHNSDVEINESELLQYIKKEYPDMRCDKIVKVFKKNTVISSVRTEVGFILNINGVLFEGMPSNYASYDDRGTGSNFTFAEMDYLRALDLYTEFCDLLAFKQIFLNELLIRNLEDINRRMQNAGIQLM